MNTGLQNPVPSVITTSTNHPPDARNMGRPRWSMSLRIAIYEGVEHVLNGLVTGMPDQIHCCITLAFIEEEKRDRSGFKFCGTLVGAALVVEGEL